ncbi:MAG: nuclear transport factor 2 family protein [Thermomicrobiales bacterium]
MDRTILVEKYLDTWNEIDANKRQAMLAELWTEHGTYTDPMADITGIDQVAALISKFQEQLPGVYLKRTGDVETHHNLARFTWDLLTPTGGVVARGMDVAVFSEDHRFESVLGFFDQAPELE